MECSIKFAASFSLLVGLGMIGQWAASYFSKQIPELKTEPIRIAFHILAEVVTALVLIVSGVALLMNASWGRDIFLISIGMLFSTSIVSPGYFAQKGQWAWLAMFVTIIGVSALSPVPRT